MHSDTKKNQPIANRGLKWVGERYLWRMLGCGEEKVGLNGAQKYMPVALRIAYHF